ncbi:MAG: hypothetical protein ABSA45_06590 [Verrucomicrobiota bacterium]
MKRVSAGTNSVPPKAKWHTVTVTPRPGAPKIHTAWKFNPVWWFGNTDDPVAPQWYRPNGKHRTMMWHFRNPFHNFDFYVIGVADKKFIRSGRYPENNSNPNGGWNFAVGRRKLALLPFLSYQRARFNFYFGWRSHGSFGIKLNVSAPPGRPPAKDSQPNTLPKAKP